MPPLPVLPGVRVVRALEKAWTNLRFHMPEKNSMSESEIRLVGAAGSEHCARRGAGHHPARMGLPSDEMARNFLIEPPGGASLPTAPLSRPRPGSGSMYSH
jgi:hypothetical protein